MKRILRRLFFYFYFAHQSKEHAIRVIESNLDDLEYRAYQLERRAEIYRGK